MRVAAPTIIGTSLERLALPSLKPALTFFEQDTNDFYIVESGNASWLLIAAGDAIVGSGVATQVAYWTDPNTLAGNAGMTYTAATGSLLVTSLNAANVPVTVRAAAAQTANLQEWRRSDNTIGISINAENLFYAPPGNTQSTLNLEDAIVQTRDAAGNLARMWFIAGDDTYYFGHIDAGTWNANADLRLAAMDDIEFYTDGVTGAGYTIGAFVGEGSGKFYLGPSHFQNVTMAILSNHTAIPGIVMRGLAGQVAHLQEWQSSTPTTLSVITAAGWLGIGTSTVDRLIHGEVSDATTNVTVYAQRLSHVTSGLAAANFGTGTEHELEDAGGNNRIAVTFETYWTNPAAANFSAAYEINVVSNTAMLEMVRMDGLDTQPEVRWNAGGADVDFAWEASGVDPALFIQGSDGYVGIGTTPAERLHVAGLAGDSQIVRLSGVTDSIGVNFTYTIENTGTATAIRAVPIFDPQAAGQTLYTLNNNAQIDGANNITAFYGQFLRLTALATASQTLTTAYYLRVRDVVDNSGGAFVITTQYGLYMDNLTFAGTNYAIYTNTGLIRFGDLITATDGITLTGAAAAVITLNDNAANAHTVVDAGATEYLRYITTNAQPVVVWNEGGADVDFAWEASGVDPALFIQGSDGFIGFGGVTAPTQSIEGARAAGNLRVLLTTYSATDTQVSAIHLRKSSSATLFTIATTVDGEALGEIKTWGVNTTPAFALATVIRATQDGAAGAVWLPTKIEWRTATDAAAPATKMALLSDGNVVIQKTSGIGIQVEIASPTFPFRDLLGNVFARNTGSSKPTFTVYRDTVEDYQFGVGDEEFFKFHIPHDYVAGTDLFIHIHWSHIGTFVTGGTVTFEYEATYAKGYNQAAFPATVTGTVVGTASAVQYQHIISEDQLSDPTPAAGELDTDDLEPDGIIIMRVELQANAITVSEGVVPEPFIHYVDIHYQSTNMGTKDKNVPFYV